MYLVTTPIEKTWPKEGRILFLGEWCKIYNKKHIWGQRDYEVLDYHWDNRKKYFNDYLYLTQVYEFVLKALSTKLNEIHNENYSERYWRILIGPWLTFFIHAIFDRWTMIEMATSQYKSMQCNLIQRTQGEHISKNMTHFGSKAINDDWNEIIYSELITKFFSDQIKINTIEIERKNTVDDNLIIKKPYKNQLVDTVFKLVNKLSKKNEFFFIDTLMPRHFDLKLQLKLRQIPKIWSRPEMPDVEPNLGKRNWSLEFPSERFYSVLNFMIPRHIPSIYIEGYKILSTQLDSLNWPKSPKAILTGNIGKHESINMWLAKKTEEGVPLFIRQHGGVYGICKFSSFQDHEIAVSDYWLSWGWKDYANDKVIPFGQHKYINNDVTCDSNGGALIVGVSTVRYSCQILAHHISGQWKYYFEDQVNFVEALPETLRPHITVRLMYIDHGVCQKQRWRDKFDDVFIEESKVPLKSLIEKNRIYISTYNATTFLESLSWNIPTIIYWDSTFNELNERAEHDFELLKSVGIFHDSPKSAAKHLTTVWHSIPAWWNDKKLQDIRENFCSKYVKTSTEPIKEFVAKIETLL